MILPPDYALRAGRPDDAAIATAIANEEAAALVGRGAALDPESPTGATRLYERVGMTATPSFMFWDRERLPDASSPAT